MRSNGQMNAKEIAEIEAFLDHSREKTVEDVLGEVAKGHLGQSLITATLATGVLMVVLTIVPWAIGKSGILTAAPSAAVEKSETAAPAKSTAATESTAAPASTSTAPVDPQKDPKVLEHLGIGEEKAAPAGVNPLESKIDDLFDETK